MSNYMQREARELAERHDTGYDAHARRIREENIRRTNAAAATPMREDRRDLTWLMRDVCSTPYAEVRS